MTKKNFYLMLFAAAVALLFALGLARNFPFFDILKKTLYCAVFASFSGLVLGPFVSGYLARFDDRLSGWGIDTSPDGGDDSSFVSGFAAAAAVVYLVSMLMFMPQGTYITEKYILKARLDDGKLAALAAVDAYNYRGLMKKYGVFIEPRNIESIPKAAIEKMKGPDRVREAALMLSKDYGSLSARGKSEAFVRAVERLREMKKEDQLRRLYYGICEQSKDRGLSVHVAALGLVVDNIKDRKFLESVAVDENAPPEVKRAAERILGGGRS